MNENERLQFEIIGSEIRLKGYPDAVKVIRAPKTENCRKLADASLHHADLSFALESLDAVNSPDLSEHIRESLWRSAIVHCYKCFQQSDSRVKLKAGVVFASSKELMKDFQFFSNLRDKHFVHDSNAWIQCDVGAILNDGKKGHKIEGVFASNLLMQTRLAEDVARFQGVVRHIHAHVQKDMDSLTEAVMAELEKKKYEYLIAMPNLVQTSPFPAAVGARR